jgi:hypothetical protein
VLKGLPAVNYAARDIVYRPRNVRAHRVYGFSPVQQVLMTVNIGLRRQLWQLDYFTEGSIPDALIGVPQGWTPDQIKQFQDYWDTEFSGDLAKRRRAKFVPGDTASRIHQTKEPQHKDEFDEWLARIICFAFSVPPQWAVKAMNRATAQNQSEQSEAEGLEPTKEWVKDLIDEIVAEEFASPDLELHWLEEDEGEPEKVLEDRLKVGAVTLNEMRDALGLDPYDNAAADRPMVLTASGYVPIEANVSGQGATTNANNGSASTVQKLDSERSPVFADQSNVDELSLILRKYGYNPEEPRTPKRHIGGGEWTRVAASDDPNEALDAPQYQEHGEGHHWVPEAVLKKFKLRPDTRKVLEDATSGALADPTSNYFTREHRRYNDAVEGDVRKFLSEIGSTDEQMTPEQAEVLYRRIRGSNDPIIGGMNRKIIRQRLRYIEYFYLRGGRSEE